MRRILPVLVFLVAFVGSVQADTLAAPKQDIALAAHLVSVVNAQTIIAKIEAGGGAAYVRIALRGSLPAGPGKPLPKCDKSVNVSVATRTTLADMLSGDFVLEDVSGAPNPDRALSLMPSEAMVRTDSGEPVVDALYRMGLFCPDWPWGYE